MISRDSMRILKYRRNSSVSLRFQSLLWLCLLLQSGPAESQPSGGGRIFASSFESISDFSGFYIVTPGEYDSDHGIFSDIVHEGKFSHKAWILKARAENNDGAVYLPHRAYPTIQFQKRAGGVFKTPCLVTLWVYLDMALADRPAGQIDDWFSFMTLSPDPTDNWARTVVVNIVHDGYVRLVHVPRQGEQQRLFQAGPQNDPQGVLRFPYRQWVRLDAFINFDSANGYAKVWQNGALVSHANVEGGLGTLAQAHFGLYASAAIPSGAVYNDKLRIIEVANEAEAAALINEVRSVNRIQDVSPQTPFDAIRSTHGATTIRIAFPDKAQNKVEIVDVRGAVAARLPVKNGEARWNRRNLAPGLYLVRAVNSKGMVSLKLAIIH